MDYQSLYLKTVVDLRKMAKDMGIRIPSGANKAVVIDLLLEADRPSAADEKSNENTSPKRETKADLQTVREREDTSFGGKTRKATEKSAGVKVAKRTAEEANKPVEKQAGEESGNAAPGAETEPSGGVAAAVPEKTDERAGAKERFEENAENRAEAKATVQEKAEEAGRASGASTESAARQPAQMRMAANPQVIDRRMPGRGYGDRGNIAAERSAVEAKNKTGYAPRPRGVQPQNGDVQPRAVQQAETRGSVRQDAARFDKRQEGPQNRYSVRPEGYVNQTRGNQRYDGAAGQNRYNARQDASEGRTRTAPENQNRYDNRMESAPENRIRYRQDSVDNRVSQWQDGGERNAVRNDFRRESYRDNYMEENQSDGMMSRNQPCRSGEAMGREWGYAASDAMEYVARPNEQTPYVRSEGGRTRREGYYNEEYKTSNPAVPEMLAAGECTEGSGILEIQQDGYGFLRAENYQQGNNDVYISIAQIRRFNLRMGDHVVGQTRPQREGDRYTAMMYITEVNGQPPESMIGRRRFEDLIPVYPDERLRLEQPGENDLSLRLIDMIAPIGKGQRGLIVSQPKAGKTTLLKKLANAITVAHPEIHLIVLLIDERPEEVTDMKRSIKGEVVYSTFDETPESHARVAEMVLERSQRLVEMGKDVVVLMDSITRLARAYNLVIPPTGRSLSGGLDPGALHKPKRFFGAARNIENGGSLTVIATALIDTGSRMDDIIYEEFKGTGNMELHLDRKLSDRRIFPAVDMVRSGTRREELLLTESELEGAYKVRRMLPNGNEQGEMEKIIALMEKTGSNAEFFQRLAAWRNVYEKSGFSMSKDTGNGR